MRHFKIIFMSATLFLVAGCATVSPGGYYWGDYDYTSLNVIKDSTAKTRNAHQAELQEIIGKSAELGLRTPPGIHAELGQLYVKKDQMTEALAQFQLEIKLYPESKIFLDKLTAGATK
jgi:hypothetical protein